MLFEQILNDRDLASLTKELICHRHTVYLKVAIVDRKLLFDFERIASRFLNLLLNAGRRWVDEHNLDAGIYRVMQKLISSVTKEFKGDIFLFEHYYDELVEHLAALERRVWVQEERSREATKGRDRLAFSQAYAEEV